MKNETKEKLYVSLVGGIGGATPYLLRFTHEGLASHEGWTQGFISLLSFLPGLGIGVGSALLFKGDFLKDSIKALILLKLFLVGVGGMTSTVVVVITIERYDYNPYMPPVTRDSGDQTQQSDGVLKIVGKKDCNECDIWFFNKDKQVLKKETFLDKTKNQSFDIPHDATAFGIWNDEINPNKQQLEKDARGEFCYQSYQFDYKREYLNDLRRGFGRYDIRPFDAEFSHRESECT